ncbi:glycine-rich cell wall structural protein [Drosophila elegans]|uniref:glycine-rich cell wall structural protein n=1 Tax=Drosophila elegans TaxID=30023 RepID=UPI0007E611DC|nr:glycine-rich cell wall structural protein [Drosophila elegans]
MRSYCLIFALCLLGLVAAKSPEQDGDQWIWRSYNRRERSFRNIDRSSPIKNSYDQNLRREPTTRRPLPGEPENDEIEDYADVDPTRTSDTPTVGTRQFNPYGGQTNAGQFGGGVGGGVVGGGVGGGYGGNPGVLVGPGGPTGIIGRPQVYPNPYQPGFGGFSGGQNGIGGYPGGGYAGVGQGFPGSSLGTGFPGTGVGNGFNGYASNGLGLNQFPSNGQQFPYGSYPGGDFGGNQFAAPGGQFPGLGQYPSNQQFGGPQYTEGYGLAGGLGLGQLGAGNGGIGYGNSFPPLGGFGFDEKSPAVAEGKSAKSVAAAPRTVNDKLNKKV